MNDILISVNPLWVKAYERGDKRIEVRTTFPTKELPLKVWVYETLSCGGRGKVVGYFIIEAIGTINPKSDFNSEIEKDYLKRSCLSVEEVQRYFNKKPIGYLWIFNDYFSLSKPKTILEFGVESVPQSWIYINHKDLTELDFIVGSLKLIDKDILVDTSNNIISVSSNTNIIIRIKNHYIDYVNLSYFEDKSRTIFNNIYKDVLNKSYIDC